MPARHQPTTALAARHPRLLAAVRHHRAPHAVQACAAARTACIMAAISDSSNNDDR
jgi:hypothetical protein